MQVISEDPGITIESLATLVKLTPYGIRYHLAGLAKSVGLHHSSDRKGGVWEVTGTKKRAQEAAPSRHPVGTQSRHPVGTQSRHPVCCGTEEAIQERVIAFCDVPRSTKELLYKVGRSDRTKFKRFVLRVLVEDGILEWTIPDKPNSRLQKYQLTAKGRKLAAMLAKNTAKPKEDGGSK